MIKKLQKFPVTIQIVRNWANKISIKILFETFPHQNFFANIFNPLNNVPGVYLIIEILEGFYWKGLLKEEALEKL